MDDFDFIVDDLLGSKPTQDIGSMIDSISEKYGVDKNLVHSIAKAESSNNPNAISGKGARGIMQLMPGTAKDMGVTNVHDPAQNIEGGVKYLSLMLDKFDGDPKKALAAYNWGPNNDIENPDKYPKETKDYINKVLKGAGDVLSPKSAIASNKQDTMDFSGVVDDLLGETPKKQEPPKKVDDTPRWKKITSEMARPTLEGGGLLAGGALTLEGGPLAVAGAALGYTAGSEIADRLDEYLGLKQPPAPMQQAKEVGTKIAEGATYEMGGQIFGKALSWTGQKIASLFRGKEIGLSPESAVKKAGDFLKSNTTDTIGIYADNAAQAQKLGDELGIQYTLGQLTNDPRLIMAERAKFKTPGGPGELGKEQFFQGQKAIKDYADINLGGGDVSATENAILRKQIEKQTLATNAQNELDTLISHANTGMNDIGSGKTIVESIQARKAAARMRAGELYDAVPNVELPPDNLKTTIDYLRSDFDSSIEKMTNFPKKILDGIESKIIEKIKIGEGSEAIEEKILKDISFQDLRKIRTTVGEDLREATSGLKPNGQLARRLGKLLDTIDGTIEQAGTLPGEAGAAYREASDFYRLNYVDPFKKGVVKDILTKDATGAAKVRNSQVASRFLQPGELGVEVADDFFRAVGDDQLAKQSMKDYVQHQMASSITDDLGDVVPKKLSAFVNNFGPALEKYGLMGDVSSIKSASHWVTDTSETLSLFEKSAAARALGSSPENIVPEIFKGGMINPVQRTREIVNILGNDKPAIEGLKTAIKDHIMQQAETNGVEFAGMEPISNARLKKAITKFEPVLKELYKNEPEKMEAVKNIRTGMDILYRNQSSPLGGGSDTMENILHAAVDTGSGFPFIGKKMVVLNSIRSMGKIVTKYGDENANMLINRAIFDPNLAFNLMYTAEGKMPLDVFERKLSSYIVPQIMAVTDTPNMQEGDNQ